MRKIIILLIFLYVSTLPVLIGQSIPKISPPSATSYNFATYGNVKLSNNSGSLTHNIPLYTIKEKDIEMPISLTYSSNGVRVDEMAGVAGVGWSLNAGGVITCVLRDKPDETTPFWQLEPTDFTLQDGAAAVDIVKNSSSVDTQRDWYYFNINGLSGAFYKDQQGDKYKYIVDSEDYVEIKTIAGGAFIVTDGKGYTYTLSEIERSTTYNSSPGMDIPTRIGYNSAWYLTEIKSPSNNILKISYIKNHAHYISGESLSVTYTNIDIKYLTKEQKNRSILETWTPAISKVEFTEGYVEFIYSDINKRLDGGGLLIENMKIHSNKDGLQKNFEFTHSQTEAYTSDNKALQYRYYLDKVFVKDKENKSVHNYQFDYYSKEKLPARMSNYKDAYGYYNGSASGYFDLDLLENEEEAKRLKHKFGTYYFSGNRKVNPNNIYYGMLKSITYPTGGKTEFLYEPNKTIETKTKTVYKEERCALYLQYGKEPGLLEEISYNDTEKTTEFVSDGSPFDINISTNLMGINTPVRFSIAIYSGRNYLYSATELVGKGWTVKDIRPSAGTKYTVRLRFETKLSPPAYAVVSVNFPYKRTSQDVKYDAEVYTAGVRVAQVTDYNNDNEVVDKTQYYYTALKDIQSAKTTLKYKANKQYLHGHFNFIEIDIIENTGTHSSISYKNFYNVGTYIFHSATAPLIYDTRSGSKPYYTHITSISKGNGAIERIYDYRSEKPPIFMYESGALNALGSNVYNGYEGTIQKENYYNETDGKYNLVKSIDYHYQTLDSIRLYNIYLERTPSNLQTQASGPIILPKNTPSEISALVWISLYYDCINRVRLSSVEEKLYDDSGNVSITQRSVNSYNGAPYYSLKRKLTEGSSQNNIITEYKYVPELIGQQNYMTNLKDKGIVTIPIIETQKLQKAGTAEEIQTSSTHLYYGQFGNTTRGVFYMPNKIDVFGKSNSILIDQKNFQKYDEKGNLLQYTGMDGVPAIFIWSYGYQHPIAEIKNATYEQVEAAVKAVFGVTNIDALSKLQSPDESKIRSLRSNASLKDALVTTYTYKPLVGISTATDPSGKTSYYEYDSFNRLKTIKDHEGNIIEEYDYNYRNK